MNKIVIILLVLTSSFGIGQKAVIRDVGDFYSVRVFDRISVVLIPSHENRIEIIGDRSEEVELVNKNGVLRIKMSITKLLKGEEITAKLYYKNIEEIEASEGAVVFCDQILKNISFRLNAKEGAIIRVSLDVQKVDVRVNSGGIIDLLGEAKVQDVVVTSGGTLNAKKLETSQTNVSVNAGGNVAIYAVDLVDAKVRAGGKIMIYGKPKEITQKTMLGGTIEEVE